MQSKTKWLRFSWQNGRFLFQRSAVQVESLDFFYNEHVTVNCCKDENKQKEAGNGHF